MRVGSLVYATNQGLGYLAKAFYDHGVVTDVIVVAHGKRTTHAEWYPKSWVLTDLHDPRQKEIVEEWTRHMDVMLYFETPFLWPAMRRARASVLMPMHECMPVDHPEPDYYFYPSLLDQRQYMGTKVPGEFIPVPVEVPWKQCGVVRTFVHNAGHGGLRGRNGTLDLYTALQYVKSPAKLILRTQASFHGLPQANSMLRIGNVAVDYRFGTAPHEELYAEGDAFVFPEKFNGLSLPLQEAYASGMLVIATDRFPMNDWLPRGPLIPVQGVRTERISPRCMTFQEAVLDPKDIAARIDEWYGKDASMLSRCGREWAEANSWDVLKPRYTDALAKVAGG